jgi:integrase
MRVGEALGLRWGDIQFADGVIAVHTGYRELKSETSDRDVPIPGPLAAVLDAHAGRMSHDPGDLIFAGVLGDYWRARRVWRQIVKRAGISYCRIHDLRHTFGVHAARAGVPLARLQRLLGHAHPHMTMRYMRHAPNGDFAADAARVAESMAALSAAKPTLRSA